MVHKARAAGRRAAEGVHLAKTSYRLTALLVRRLVACLAATASAIAAALLTNAVVRIAVPHASGWGAVLAVVGTLAVTAVVAVWTYRSIAPAGDAPRPP
jgi:hypothetical protein